MTLPMARATPAARWTWVDALALLLATTCAVLTLFPLVWMVSTALKPANEIFRLPPTVVPSDPHWDNFVQAARLVPLLRYALNSLTIAVASVVGTVISAGIVAYGFARLRAPGLNVLFLVLLATVMLPDTVTLVPSFVMLQKLGWVGTYLPLIVPSWLGGGAFNIFLLRQFLLTIPRDQDDAARIDGAGHWTIMWRILAPQALPAFVAVATFDFLSQWNDFLRPLIYLNDASLYTLALGINSFKDLYFTQWNLLMAASVLATAPSIVLLVAGQRLFLRGVPFGNRGASL